MADVPAPTKAQLQLLEHIAAGRVTRHYSMRNKPSRVILRLPVADNNGRTSVTVTSAVQKLQLAGWAVTKSLGMGQIGGSAPVLLTAAGGKHTGRVS